MCSVEDFIDESKPLQICKDIMQGFLNHLVSFHYEEVFEAVFYNEKIRFTNSKKHKEFKLHDNLVAVNSNMFRYIIYIRLSCKLC